MDVRNNETNPSANLLDYYPQHKVDWEENNGVVVLLLPKFTNRFLVRYILPRLNQKNFKIKLDEFGSWVWKEIDGEKSVLQIAEGLSKKFGDRVEPVYDRLGMFIKQLVSRHFITLLKEKG